MVMEDIGLAVRKDSMPVLLLLFLLAVSFVSAAEGKLHLLSMVFFFFFLWFWPSRFSATLKN